jgi:hypothetical protein
LLYVHVLHNLAGGDNFYTACNPEALKGGEKNEASNLTHRKINF